MPSFSAWRPKLPVNVIHSADIRRKTQQIAIKLITSELVVGRQQRMGFRLSLDLLDFDQSLIAVTRRCPSRINRSSETVEINGIHPPVAQIGVVRDGQQLIARLALGVHPFPKVLGCQESREL